ncbi:MAG: nuclear transport factor 2 family protein [Anaerolineales bacterium]|nr:nuclear transport factor 2 family protein [Anaerolineales bacterium]MBK8824955.1 nuclear transport factor 2 family protein [Anaerolineales bacterium]
MTPHTDLFLTYLRHYAAKDLQAISAMFAEDIHLRDWNISVHGKDEAIRETAKNFTEAESIEIRVLVTYENADTVAGELHIVVDGRVDLYVVDVVTFNAQGSITAIRSYKGRED